MHEDIRLLLNACLDGELEGRRLQQVQAHLAVCAECRAELDELRRVSALLKAAPLPKVKPADVFAANLMLTLPRREMREASRPQGSPLWWLVPAGILGAWVFLQTTLLIANAVSIAGVSGLFEQASAWLNTGSDQAAWYTAASMIGGSQMSASSASLLSLLNTADGTSRSIFTGFILQAGIMLAYCIWLAAWWTKRRPRSMQQSANHLA